jgi:hypothetical protein
LKVKELLNLIPQTTWDKLIKETNVNYKAKKLDGQLLFSLLLYSLVTTKNTSLRVMEQLFNSYLFKSIHSKPIANDVKYTSIGQRLASINYAFFEKLYLDCINLFGSELTEKENRIIRFDSTLVSISAKLVDIGFVCGGGQENKRQLKFTIGFSELAEYVSFYHESKFNSENVALKNSILNCKIKKDTIALFDRGIQARDTYDEFTDKNIVFITRINENHKFEQVKKNAIQTPVLHENLVIVEDSTRRLFNRNKKLTKHSFRFIKAKNKKTNEEICFLTNINYLTPQEISTIYKKRWEIEVFFKFLKQELNFSHLLSRNENGIKVVLYTTLILSILLTVYKKQNKLKGYKIPKLKFSLELEEEIIKHLIIIHGGRIDEKNKSSNPFWNTS